MAYPKADINKKVKKMYSEVIENRIIEQLQKNEFFNGWTVEAFPEDFKSYNFTSAMGCLLVRFNGADYTKPETLNAVVQHETSEFSIAIGLRYINSLKEAHPVLREVYKTLTGTSLMNEKIYPKSCNYLGHLKGDVFYDFVFNITLPISSPADKAGALATNHYIGSQTNGSAEGKKNVYKFSPFTKTKGNI